MKCTGQYRIIKKPGGPTATANFSLMYSSLEFNTTTHRAKKATTTAKNGWIETNDHSHDQNHSTSISSKSSSLRQLQRLETLHGIRLRIYQKFVVENLLLAIEI